jgi:hypothetical protein
MEIKTDCTSRRISNTSTASSSSSSTTGADNACSSPHFTRCNGINDQYKTFHNVENSHLIQVHTGAKTIWRGNETSLIELKVKVNRRFLKTEAQSFRLHAYVDKHCESNEPFLTKQNDCCVKCNFLYTAEESDTSIVNVDERTLHHELHVSVDKCLFKDGDHFRVIVQALPLFEDCGEVLVFGASPMIRYVL